MIEIFEWTGKFNIGDDKYAFFKNRINFLNIGINGEINSNGWDYEIIIASEYWKPIHQTKINELKARYL